jgi:MFS family permease
MKNGLPPASPPDHGVVPGARTALTLLICINIFNFVDRQVLAAVEPNIRRDFFNDSDDSMFWTGLLSTAFLVTYMLLAPVFGWLSNRMSRWVLIGIGVVLWSLASGGTGLAGTYAVLLLTRCLVGVGEAIYGPIAPDVISDLYPVRRRGQILAWFYAAIPVGGALGYALGGQVVAHIGDWRWAFYLVVPPGILLGVWCYFMREPPRGLTDGVAHHIKARKLTLADFKMLAKTPSYVLNCLGMTAMSFAMGGLAYWAPAFLEERNVAPVFGVEPKTAFGAFTALSGLVATLVGGIAGDWLKPRFSGSYFLVSGAAMVIAAPLLILMVWLPFPLAWIPLVLFVFFLFFNTGPTNTILANVTHPMLRASGFAVNILIIHLFGDAISPPVMGWIAGWSRPKSLDPSFLFVSALVLLGGVLWLWGTRYLERDTLLAPTRLGALPPEKEEGYPEK